MAITPSEDVEKAAVAAQVADGGGGILLSGNSDEETGATSSASTNNAVGAATSSPPRSSSSFLEGLRRLNARLEGLAGFEARGITRVLPSERQAPSRAADLQVLLLWFSANISVNNLAVGLFGPLVFNLGFLDCAMCAVFGALLGSCSTAYMSIWGPQSGNRTMVR